MAKKSVTVMVRAAAVMLAVLPMLLSGCAGQPGATKAALGEEFTLAIGQGASIRGENLEIRFAGVASDSRCPEGATCVWAGEASAKVEVTEAGAMSLQVLTQPGRSGPVETDLGSYRVTFDIRPYPRLGEEITDGDYRLLLTVSR